MSISFEKNTRLETRGGYSLHQDNSLEIDFLESDRHTNCAEDEVGIRTRQVAVGIINTHGDGGGIRDSKWYAYAQIVVVVATTTIRINMTVACTKSKEDPVPSRGTLYPNEPSSVSVSRVVS